MPPIGGSKEKKTRFRAGICLLFFGGILEAATVSISWDANTETDLAGYKVYYGTQSRTYATVITLAKVTQYEIPGLVEGTTYYFAVTAYDLSGNESDYSSEVPLTITDTTPPTLVKAEIIASDQVRLTFSEPIEKSSAEIPSNYRIDNGAIVVLSAALQSDNQTVILTTTDHSEGTHTVSVSNIRDRAIIPNTIGSGTTATYTYTTTDTQPPRLVDIKLARGEDIDYLSLFFDEPIVQTQAFNLANYRIEPSDVMVRGIGISANQKTLILTTTHHLAGQEYTIFLSNLRDAFGNVIPANTAGTYRYTPSDANPPVLLAARIVLATRLELDFNEPLDPVSATRISNYTIYASGTSVSVTGAALSADGMTVILTTSAHGDGNYTVRVENIADRANPPNPCGPQEKGYRYTTPDQTPPVIAGITLIEANLVAVTFSEAVDAESAQQAANYRITSTSGTTISVYQGVVIYDGRTVYLTTDPHPAGTYTLSVSNVRDVAGNAIVPNSQKTYDYQPPDKEKPRLLGARLHGADILDLRFSEPLERISAETQANYTITPAVAIYGASLVGDSLNHVYLRTASHQLGVTYTVTVREIRDQAVVPNTIEARSQAVYTYLQNDTEKPRLIGAQLKGDRFLELTFSEPLHEEEAQNPANYLIVSSGPSVAVYEARLDISLKKVYLTTGAHDVGVEYTILVSNVQDRATPPNRIGSDNSWTYRLTSQDLIPPIVQNVELYGNSLLEVVFSEPVDPLTAENPTNYSLRSGNGGTAPLIVRVRMGYSPNVVRIETTPHQQGRYELSIRNIRDLAKSPNVMPAEVTWPYVYLPPDGEPPLFVRLTVLADNMLQIDFSEPLDGESARNLANYRIDGEVEVLKAYLDDSLRRVILQTTRHLPGVYQIEIRGVKDQYGNAITTPVIESYRVEINDADPPQIVRVEPLDDHRIRIVFNEPLDAESAQASANYAINRNVNVLNAVLEHTLSQVLLETTPFSAGTYTLTVNGVRDASTNRNEIAPYTQVPFTWNPMDTTPPALVAVQPFTETTLEVYFSEAVNADDAQKTENYTIDPYVRILRASLQIEGNRVWLITEAHEPGRYTLTARNIRDRAMTPNTIRNQNTVEYLWSPPDTSAPRLLRVLPRTPMMLELVFDEPVSSLSARDLANYRITPSVAVNGAYLLEDRRIVHLETGTHTPKVEYTIEVQNLEDRAPIPNRMKRPQTMKYTWESADTTAPWITEVKPQGTTLLEVVFSEKVEKISAETRSNYTIRTGVEVKNAVLDTLSMRKVYLETTIHLPGVIYEITARNIKDLAPVPNVIASNKWYSYQITTTTPMVDNTPPQVARIDPVSRTRIEVLFTEPVERSSAENPANYTISDSVQVLTAELDSNQVRVRLITTRHREGKPYTIQVRNIRDRAARPNQLTVGAAVSYILVDGVAVSQPNRGSYTLGQCALGSRLYTDRDLTIMQAPNPLLGSIQIMTRQQDRTDTTRAFLWFEVTGESQVIVGIDKNQPKPAWLAGWRPTGDQVVGTHSVAYNLYAKTVGSGRVTLGGNGGSVTGNMYLVFIRPMAARTDWVTALSKARYEPTHVEEGDAYYIDRDYRIALLPDSLRGLLWIKTANDDKASTGTDFLRFSVRARSLVYIGYDIRIPSLPRWLADWEKTGEEIVDNRGSRFLVYQKEFPSGEVVLGGNYGKTDDNMYLILIRPLERIDEESPTNLPGYFTLEQNYPNPFNPETTIRFMVHKTGYVRLAVYNLLGQRVQVLFERRVVAGYRGEVVWDGRDEAGCRVASGVYFYRIEQDHFAKTKRMLLIK